MLGKELETDMNHKSAEHIVGLAQEIAEVMEPVRVTLAEEHRIDQVRRRHRLPRGVQR